MNFVFLYTCFADYFYKSLQSLLNTNSGIIAHVSGTNKIKMLILFLKKLIILNCLVMMTLNPKKDYYYF